MLNISFNRLQSPPGYLAASGFLSIFSLSTAYFFQFFLGLQPCILCLYQRIPFAVIIVAAAIGYIRPRTQTWMLIVITISFMINAGIAAFHTGIEQGWWQMTETCDATIPNMTVEELKTFLMTQELTRCDDVQWSILGLSMANLNVILCLVMTFIGLKTWRRKS